MRDRDERSAPEDSRKKRGRLSAVSKILGIDLGTTNCCVAVVEGATPAGAREPRGQPHDAVDRRLHRGRRAARRPDRQAAGDHEPDEHGLRRQATRRPQVRLRGDARTRARSCPTRSSRAATATSRSGRAGREYSPEEISAFILREIKEFSEEALGEEITEAIITVPAYFDDAQRQATRDAGRIAGLEVLRIINEPTAASLAYGLDRKGSEIVAVYDLGGGTFDISILELGDGIYEVKATAGDTYLGGEDFDKKIMDWLLADFQKVDRHRPAAGPHGAAAAEGGRREGQVRALDARWRRRSRCRSSPPTPRAPSTSTGR